MAIRKQPEDFTVTERLDERFTAGFSRGWSVVTPHVVYELTKSQLTTPDAIAFFARELRISPGAVDYAGLKDKHAVTTQFVSFPISDLRAAQNTPVSVAPKSDRADSRGGEGGGGGGGGGGNWSARFVAFSARPVVAESIGGNAFVLAVRDLTKAESDAMTRRSRDLATSEGTLAIVNYFGAQRFGGNRHGQGWAALPLIRGEFLEAIRLIVGTPARKDSGRTRDFTRLCAQHWGEWKVLAETLPKCPELRVIEALAAGKQPHEAFGAVPGFLQQMCVEAFQSVLWNETVRRFVSGLPGQKHVTPDEFGEMVFPFARALGDDVREMEIPMFAPKSVLAEPWRAAAEAALAEQGVVLEELRVPMLRRPQFGEAMRPVVMRCTGFAISPPLADELDQRNPMNPTDQAYSQGGPVARFKRVVEFDLPRGSYATVVLRALGQ